MFLIFKMLLILKLISASEISMEAALFLESKVHVYIYFSENDSKLFVVRRYLDDLSKTDIYTEKNIEYCEHCRDGLVRFVKNLYPDAGGGFYTLNLSRSTFEYFQSIPYSEKNVMEHGECSLANSTNSEIKECYKLKITRKHFGQIQYYFELVSKKLKLKIIPDFLEYLYKITSSLRLLLS